MKVLGIDPGLTATGIGVIERSGNKITPLQWGVIRSGKGELADRLQKIYHAVVEITSTHRPDLVGVEDIFTARNPRSALLLGHARGVILIAGSAGGSPVMEYPARSVKLSVAGRGSATKEQVRFMVGKLLSIDSSKIALDASDALAIALCTMMRSTTSTGIPG